MNIFKRADLKSAVKSWCAGLMALGFVATPPATAQSAAPSKERGFMWEARKDVPGKGTQRVLLVGTRHVGRPETAALPETLLKHAAEARVLALEADTSNAQAMAEVAQRYALYGVGEALLNERIDVRLRARLEALLPRYGMNPAGVWRMKPWFLAMNLVVAELMRTGFSSAYGTETQLLAWAAAQNKRVVEIEGIELQLKLFDNALAAQQIAFLEQTITTLENGDAQKEVKTLMDAWSKGDTAAMEGVLAQMRSKAMQSAGDRFVLEQVLEARHPKMLDAIERYGASGSLHLVAVGNLHYFGPKGLISGLRERGWTVTALP